MGWFDTKLVKYAVEVNGMDGLALTKLDFLAGFETVKLGIDHDANGNAILEEMPGWGHLDGITERKDLPKSVLNYIGRIEELVGCPIVIFGTGQSRAQTYGSVSWN